MRADLMAQFKGLAGSAADLLGSAGAPGAAASFAEAEDRADEYTVELRQDLVRAWEWARRVPGGSDGSADAIRSAIEALGGWPPMPAPYVAFDTEPVTNTITYIHHHCEGTGARWCVPHDGADPREGDKVECPECIERLPLVSIQAHLLGIA